MRSTYAKLTRSLYSTGGAHREYIDPNKTAHEQIFIFCVIWSFGAFLETHDRSRLESYLDKHTKLKMPKLAVDGDTIFNYNVNVHNGHWTHWDSTVKDYIPPEITPQTYSSLLIPNVSSIRTNFLIDVSGIGERDR